MDRNPNLYKCVRSYALISENNQLRQLTMATLPPWVISMLEAEFYNKCEEHLKRCTSFCRDCPGKLLCETCTEAMADEHEGHKILKVI